MSSFQDGVTVDIINRDLPIYTTPRRTMLTVVYEYYTSSGSGFTFGYRHHGCSKILCHVGLRKKCFSHPLSSSGTHIHITASETWGRPVQFVRYLVSVHSSILRQYQARLRSGYSERLGIFFLCRNTQNRA